MSKNCMRSIEVAAVIDGFVMVPGRARASNLVGKLLPHLESQTNVAQQKIRQFLFSFRKVGQKKCGSSVEIETVYIETNYFNRHFPWRLWAGSCYLRDRDMSN